MWQSHAKLSFLNDDEDRAQPRREGRQNSLKSRGGRGRPTWLSMSRKRHGSWVECSFMLLILTVTSVRVLVKTRQWKWRRFASTYSTYEYVRNGVCVCICLCVRSYADKMNGLDRQKHKTDWVDMTKIVGNQLKGCHTYTPKHTHTYTHDTHVQVCGKLFIYTKFMWIFRECLNLFPMKTAARPRFPFTPSFRRNVTNCNRCARHKPKLFGEDMPWQTAAISHFSHISRIVGPAWK